MFIGNSYDNQLQVIPCNNGNDITLSIDYANPLQVRRHISDLKNIDVFMTLEGQECQSQTNVDNDRYMCLILKSKWQWGEERELNVILRKEHSQQLKTRSLVP